jgi:hypothetical protein
MREVKYPSIDLEDNGNKILIEKYQAQMIDGHPFVPYTRKEAIESMAKKVTNYKQYASRMETFYFRESFVIDSPEYGLVTKKIEWKNCMNEGQFDWKSDVLPVQRGHILFGRVRIKAMIDIFFQAINLQINFSEYNSESIYKEKFFRPQYLITMKDGDTYELKGRLGSHPNIYNDDILQVGNNPFDFETETVSHFSYEGVTEVKVTDIASVEMI